MEHIRLGVWVGDVCRRVGNRSLEAMHVWSASPLTINNTMRTRNAPLIGIAHMTIETSGQNAGVPRECSITHVRTETTVC